MLALLIFINVLGQNSDCSDALTQEGYDAYAYALQDFWNHEKVFRSKLACQSNRKMGKLKNLTENILLQMFFIL